MTKRLFSLVYSVVVVAFLAASCHAPALEEIQGLEGQETEVVPEWTTIPYSLKVSTEKTRVATDQGATAYQFKEGDKIRVTGTGDRTDIFGNLTRDTDDLWKGELSYLTAKGLTSGQTLDVTLIHADNADASTYASALVGTGAIEGCVTEEQQLLQYAVEHYSLFTATDTYRAKDDPLPSDPVTLEQRATFLDVTVEFDFDGSHIIDAGKALVDLSVNQKDIQMETDFYEKSGTNGEDFYVHFIAVVPGEKPVSNFTLTVGDRPITFSDTNLYLYRNRKYTVNRTIEFHPQVGDPFWSDGTYGRLRHPSSQEKIVGIVVFVHDYKENMTADDIRIADAITEKASGFGHGLVMALKNVTETSGNQVQKGFKWCSSNATSQQCTAGYITNPNQTMDSPYFSGLENTNNITSKAGYENDSAAARAKNYTYDGIAVSTSSTTGWFLPSIGQWMYTISEDGFGGADPASEWTNGKGTLWLKDGYQPDSGGNLGDLVFVKRSEDSRPEVNVLVKSLNDRLAQFHNEFGVSYDTFGDPSTETNISDNYWTSTEYAADKAIRMNLGTVEQRAGVYYSTIKAKGETKTISFYTYNSNSYQMKVRPFLAF